MHETSDIGERGEELRLRIIVRAGAILLLLRFIRVCIIVALTRTHTGQSDIRVIIVGISIARRRRSAII